jgi:hypothetical protein
MTFTANPYFALGQPAMPNLEVRFLDTPTAIGEFLNGAVHVLGPEVLTTGTDLQALFDAEGQGQAALSILPSLTWEHADFNLTIPYPTSVSTLPPSGGVITTSVGVQVQIPAGALTTTTLVTFTSQPAPSQPLNTPVLQSFSIVATTVGGAPITQFQPPLTLTIDYNEAELAALGLTESTLNVAYWNGAAWVYLLPCAGCGVDRVNNRITVILSHLTEFAVTSQARVYLPLVRR